MILRKSLFLNGILTNSEAWYGLQINDIKHLEQIDETLLRKIFECPKTTPKCFLYLETGCTPIRYIIICRRLMFLQYILKEDTDSLISQFFYSQDSNPVKNYWALTCREDLNNLDIKLSFQEIRCLSKNKFKNIVKKAISEKTFEYLKVEKVKLSKIQHIVYDKFGIQEYLLPNQTSTRMAKFIFHARSRMLDLKCNFKNRYRDFLCPTGCGSDDTQQHLIDCEKLSDSTLVSDLPEYDDLFSKDVKKILNFASILKARVSARANYVSKNS